MLPLHDDYLHAKILRDYRISSRDINGLRILQSNWMRGTTAHTQPKVVVSEATSLWWLSPTKNPRDRSIPSRDTDDQKILQGDWTRSTTAHTHPKKVVQMLPLEITWFLTKILMNEEYWNLNDWEHNRKNRFWKTRFFPDMGFFQNHNEHCYTPFLG